MAEKNIIQALNQCLHQEFAKDDGLVTFGEDVGHFGGVFRVTSGLTEKFGEERCFNSPLAEQGIVGFAIGMALMGMKPVAEIQFADYLFPAYDQMVNELSKMRYRTGGGAVQLSISHSNAVWWGDSRSSLPLAIS